MAVYETCTVSISALEKFIHYFVGTDVWVSEKVCECAFVCVCVEWKRKRLGSLWQVVSIDSYSKVKVCVCVFVSVRVWIWMLVRVCMLVNVSVYMCAYRCDLILDGVNLETVRLKLCQCCMYYNCKTLKFHS